MLDAKQIKKGMTITADTWPHGLKTGTVFDVSEKNERIRVNFTDASGESHWCYLSQIHALNGETVLETVLSKAINN